MRFVHVEARGATAAPSSERGRAPLGPPPVPAGRWVGPARNVRGTRFTRHTLSETKPPDAALRCAHRCSLSELEAARTLQVSLCDFITSHPDELPPPQVPPVTK